jgi:hypothetical protein
MKKRFLPLLIVLALLMAGLALAWTNASVSAQGGCTDPTGNPIPCPGGGGDKKTPTPVPPTVTPSPTATVTTIPTSTSLPISNSAGDGVIEVKWSGTCAGVNKNTPCTDKLINACNTAGGTPDASFDDEADTTTIICTLPAVLEPTPLPIANPTSDSDTEGGAWSGICTGETPAKFLCTAKFMDACQDLGGTFDITKDDETGRHVKCTIPSVADPNSLVLANPGGSTGDNSWDGVCNLGDDKCLNDLFTACDADGGLYEEIDFEDIGATAVHCSIPANGAPNPGGTFPPGGWLPWITGFVGLLIGLLLPAIQKVRDAAARSKLPNNKHPELVKNKDDEEPDAGVAIPNFMSMRYRPRPSSNSTDDGDPTPDEGYQYRAKRAEVPDNHSGEEDEDGMQLRSKRAEVMPQTREHILLANQPTDPSEAKSNPKPPPPPPPPPPSGPGLWSGEPLSIANGGTEASNAQKPTPPPPPRPMPVKEPFYIDETGVTQNAEDSADVIVTREDKDKG